jgi:cobalt-zinc-cadmium resistance protein CzcA
MFDKSVAAAIKNRWLVLFFAVLLGGLGVYSYTRMNIDAYPDISGVQVQITTAYSGRAAEEVEQQITVPLENTFASIPHHEVIRSRTIFGLSLVQVIFEPGVDDYWAREVVFQKIGDANLPPDRWRRSILHMEKFIAMSFSATKCTGRLSFVSSTIG